MENKKVMYLERLNANKDLFHPVVPFDPAKEKITAFDCTLNNKDLSALDLKDTDAFSVYVDGIRKQNKARYLIGGYNENRALYKRSELFASLTHSEPRTLHLGIDIWGEAGTEVYAPIGGRVHSLGYNNHFGDYGATIILMHQIDGMVFYTLYGHVGLKDIGSLNEGKFLNRGETIAHFGIASENGHWPPHLHFQLILDIYHYKGDYPGVCSVNEADHFLNNSPDPDVVLNMNRYL